MQRGSTLSQVDLWAECIVAVRSAILSATSIALLLVLSACGGGSSSGSGGGSGNGGGGNGGGGTPPPSISLVSPSVVMAGIPVGLVIVFGQGFDANSQALIDGIPTNTHLLPDGTLEVLPGVAPGLTTGVHEFAVQGTGGTSNSLPFTIYTPLQGPSVMQAIPGFLVADYAPDPPFITTADINNDGLSDVIMPAAGSANTGLAIFYGQANGLLSTPQIIPTTLNPFALAAGDVDGDGNVDLVYIGGPFGTPTMLITLLGDGHGNFQSSAQQTITANFVGPAYLADLDGDGKPDLVLAYQPQPGGAAIEWFKNLGGGNFAPPVTLAPAGARAFQIADFNGDGKLDIVYPAPGPPPAQGPQSIHILMNQGGGTFKDQAVVGLNGIVGTVNVLDFNLDGIPDLVIQVPQTNSIALYSFAGKGDGSFTQVANSSFGSPGFAPYTLVTGDFDHDGFPDLAGVNGETEPSHLICLFGDGRGNFTPQQVVGPDGFYVAVGDFNGDGVPDVVVPDRDNFISLALGRIDRNFPSPLSLTPTIATSISAGDIDGDGWPDLLIGGFALFNAQGTVFQNTRNNSFQFAANTDPGSFLLADLTGKGVVDLLSEPASNLIIYPNNGALDFSASPITIPQPMAAPSVADIDGDGHPDIVADGQVFYGNGSYQFTPVAIAGAYAPYVVGDFNGDGRLDIASGAFTYLNMGGRTFQSVRNTLPLVVGAITAVGDFNGDGKDDIAINLPGSLYISIYYSRGDGTFYEATDIDPGQYPTTLSVADFDGDGHPDLAVGMMLSEQVCVFFNSGQGQFTRSFYAAGAQSNAMIATDLNRDGKPDLAITNFPLTYRPPNAVVLFHK